MKELLGNVTIRTAMGIRRLTVRSKFLYKAIEWKLLCTSSANSKERILWKCLCIIRPCALGLELVNTHMPILWHHLPSDREEDPSLPTKYHQI